jgi:hypothetical protein
MTTKPTTAAEAKKLLTQLEVKRATLNGAIETTAARRRAAAVAAEFGDLSAQETLRRVTAEAVEAADGLQNIDGVIAEVRTRYEEFVLDEATAREMAAEAAQDEAIDEVRALLAERRDLQRVPALRQMRVAKSAGALTVRDREMASTLLGYFDFELSHLSRAGDGYASLTRVADWDSRCWGKKSPAQLVRGDRPLSLFEQTWKAAVDRPGWAANSRGGYDSTIEAAKHGKPVDVSGGWPASG